MTDNMGANTSTTLSSWELPEDHVVPLTGYVTAGGRSVVALEKKENGSWLTVQTDSPQERPEYVVETPSNLTPRSVPISDAEMKKALLQLWKVEYGKREQSESTLRDKRIQHHQDVQQIGERINAEAADRNWCSDYDEIVDELNQKLHVSLPERTENFEVTVDLRYRVTVEVEAKNGDDAVDKVNEDNDIALNQVDFTNEPESFEVRYAERS